MDGNKIEKTSLPYSGQGGKYQIKKEGSFIVFEAPSCGIRVGFDGIGIESVGTIDLTGHYGFFSC